ncbi:MAG TPA: hypothetical protein VL095_04235 [Flavisolibacter sp.]|nr:hypothetical protein [Flavisolibacter sp.]
MDKIFYFVPIKIERLTHYLLFAAYLVLFSWLLTKIKFFNRSGFTNSQLVILFLLKVMAGIFYGWIGVYYGQMAQMIDTWAYHVQGLEEYQLLISSPVNFFTSFFHNSYEGGYTNFLVSQNSWWNDAKANFFIKLMAIFDLFSFGNYYVNVIFYSFLSLFGPMAIYKVMKDVFPSEKIPVLIASFLVPSFLYWTSGLHKEGLIFLGLALLIYHLYFGFKEKKFPVYRILLLLIGTGLILILRNFLILPLFPALVAWILCQKLKFKPVFIYTIVFGVFLTLFFTAKYFIPGIDPPQSVVIKQKEFIALEGHSSVAVNELEPTFTSFLINAPQAFSLSLLRPYPSDVRHLLSLAAALEIAVLFLVFLVFLFWRKKGITLSPILLFCLFFSAGVLFMIGYSVNNLGAIVRYRSIVFPLLLVPMAAKINWSRINELLFQNIKNENNTYVS